MIYAVFDFEYKKETLASEPKQYRIGLRNECFGTLILWRWINYGLLQSALIFAISFVTFRGSPSISTGNTGDLWINGTFAYGAIVILCNTKVLYDSYSHYKGSVFVIFWSVAAYFIIIYLLNITPSFSLYSIFYESLTFPTYYLNILFFLFFTFPTDCFINFVNSSVQESQ